MSSLHDSRTPLPSGSRRQRSPQGLNASSTEVLVSSSGEPKRAPTRSGRKRRSPLATVAHNPKALKNYRGGNDLLQRTAAEGVPVPPPSSRLPTPGFGLTNPESRISASNAAIPHPSTHERPEFIFPEPAAENEKQLATKGPHPPQVDIATCSKEIFDKWLVAAVSAIPPSTASTASLRSGAVGPQKAQKNFFIRESILNNIFNMLQSALDVLQRYKLELSYHQNLLHAYFSAVEEDAQDQKPEAGKFTVFHHEMREKEREQPLSKYQHSTEEICARMDKLMYVIRRLETLEGLHGSDEGSLADVTEANKSNKKSRSSPFHMYGDDDDDMEEDNSDEDDLDAFPDGSAEKERILAKMRKSRLLKVLAKKSKSLETCLHLPTLPHEISSRLRNELVLPFSARVLSLKEISSKNNRDDQISSFVEWYVNRIVDPFAMSQLLRIVPMEYVVTTTCRLVSACDANLSLRAAQALPDFSHVMIRAVREGREEAFSQLALSPSVSFLAALQSPLASNILFYSALLLGHLDVVHRVLSSGFFHPQALLVLLFFNANWESDDCANYLHHQLQLCQEMSDLRIQMQRRRSSVSMLLRKQSRENGRNSILNDFERRESLRSTGGEEDGKGPSSTTANNYSSPNYNSAAGPSKEEKVYNRIEASLRLFFADDIDGSADHSSIANQFIYGPLERLRVLLEMRERTHQQLHDFVTSRAAAIAAGTSISPSMAGKDPTAAMFQELGLDVSTLGSVLRKELEALRWHSFFGAKMKTSASTTPSGGIVEVIGAAGKSETNHGNTNTTHEGEDDAQTNTEKLSGTFGHLMRGKWLDALVGQPLANGMLPAFSTMWLRRTDARSFLPIAASHKPVLIRSDCSVDVTEEQIRKSRLYPENAALEEREVKEAEEQRTERTRSALEYITATKRAGDIAKESVAEAANGKSTSNTGDVYRVGTNASRRNRQIRLPETYEGNYYFEAHVSVDYLILAKNKDARDDSTLSVPTHPKSTGKSSSEDPTVSSSSCAQATVNSLVIGFCTENMETDPVGVLNERGQALGMRSGSGGVSLNVVGHRILQETVVEGGTVIEQEEEVVFQLVRHQNGKVNPVTLPLTEKQQPMGISAPSTSRHFSRGNQTSSVEVGKGRIGAGLWATDVAESNNNSALAKESTFATADSASYVLMRLIRRRPVPNAYISLSKSASGTSTSASGFPEDFHLLSGDPNNSARAQNPSLMDDDEIIEETTFPLTHFITEKEFRDWEMSDAVLDETNSEVPLSPIMFGHRTDQETNMGNSANSSRGFALGPTGNTKVERYSMFGQFGVAIGFFMDMKKNTVSLSVNGIPVGVLFSRVGVWPASRLYPAATMQSSATVVDRIMVSDETVAYRATPPVLRFAFELSDIIGDQLLDTRNQWEMGTHRPFTRQRSPETPWTDASNAPTPRTPTPRLGVGFAASSSHETLPATLPVSPGPSPRKDGASVSEVSQGQATWPDAQVWLEGVKLFDKTHKFKQMLNVLSSAVVKENDHDADTAHGQNGETVENGDKDNNENSTQHRDREDTTSPGEPGTTDGDQGNHTVNAKGTNSAAELSTYQRTQGLLNQLSFGGFHDFLFFPGVHIRRRSDDGWNDLHHNGIAIIPERAVLSPLCAAIACRQREMAFAIASHFMTNMYHSNDSAVRQRRLALLGACALGYADVVQVLLERIPVYEVLSLFSIQIQREELEALRRDHRKRNILMSKMYLLKDTSGVDATGGRGSRRRYAITPVTKLDPNKMYSSKTPQYTPIHCAFLGGNHTSVITVLLNYLYTALSFKTHAQLTATYCKEYREAQSTEKLFYVGQAYPHLKDAVNVASRAGETALLIATRMNNDVIAKRLLAFGAAPDCQDRISRAFALEIACANQFLPIAKALFSTEAYSSPLMLNHAGVATPLCWCAINNMPEMIPLFLQNGADPMKGLDGNSPLLLAVTFKSEKAALCLLENCRNSRDVDLNAISPEKRKMPVINVDDVDARTQCTSLHIACELGLVEVVRALLRFHASLSIFTKGTYVTPLHTAILNGKKQAALTLLEYGKDQLRRGYSVLDINAIDKNGNSPLHLACRAGMADVVEYIVAQFSAEEFAKLSEANPSQKLPLPVDFTRANNQGKIPLLAAIQFHEVKCAELIIAYSYNKKLLYPGGAVIEGTCMAILQASAAGLDELVLLLLSYPQFQVNPKLKEEFMRSYTARRKDFDRMEAKLLAQAKQAKREAARKAREEELDYRYFPLSPEEEEETESEEEESEEEEDNVPAYVRPKFSIFARRVTTGRGKQLTNYTGALMTRTKAFCPDARRSSEPRKSKVRGSSVVGEGRRRTLMGSFSGKGDGVRETRGPANHRRSYIRELFSRTRSNISPDVALKLLLRGFALPELFVMLEEVSSQSMVVGIQSPSAMVHSESMLGFLKEHFDVNIGPSNAVKFCRDLLEHIITLFENLGATKSGLPSWYYIRDKVNDALRRCPPFCQHIVRIIRLYGKTENCKRAIDDIRNSIAKHDNRIPLMRSQFAGATRGSVTRDPLTTEELEKQLITPFRYTVLQLATNLSLAPLVSFLINELHLSPFFVPMQQTEEEGGVWRDSVISKGTQSVRSGDLHVDSMPTTAATTLTGGATCGFEYDVRRDNFPVFRDLYNLCEDKWCCSPYRLSIRSFHSPTVAVFLKLFSNTSATSTILTSTVQSTLVPADVKKVQTAYKKYFGIDAGRLPVSVMAVDYREPSWVDPRGMTALQEVLCDHLASRLSADELDDGDAEEDKMNTSGAAAGLPSTPGSGNDQIHLHRLSSLEMYRGDVKANARAIGKRLLKAGAASCGCFNNSGMDAWLLACSLDEEAGRAATSLLLRFGAPLLGCLPAHRSTPASPTNHAYMETNAFAVEKNDGVDGAATADAEKKTLTERQRIMEEFQFHMPHILTEWEENGFGIPNSSPAETFERLVFSSPIDLPGGPVSATSSPALERGASDCHSVEPKMSAEGARCTVQPSGELPSADIPPPSSTVNTFEITQPPQYARPSTGLDVSPGDTFFTKRTVSQRMNESTTKPASSNGTSPSAIVRDTFRSYAIFLLFLCVEHNHNKIMDLLLQYPTVLSSAVRHPFTRDSIVTRLLKRAVEQLIFLKEVPVLTENDIRDGSYSKYLTGTAGSRLAGRHGAGSPLLTGTKDLPFSVLVGTAISEGSQRGVLDVQSLDHGTIIDQGKAVNLLDDNAGSGNLTQGYRDPYKIPAVRSLLEVAKAVLDNFDIGNRFEPCADGETALSLAAIIGHAPIVSRIIHLHVRGGSQGAAASNTSRRNLSHTTAEYCGVSKDGTALASFGPRDSEESPFQDPSSVTARGTPEREQAFTTVDGVETRVIPELPPPMLMDTFNPSPPFNLSTALDDPMVRTLLATRLYWGEDDAGTLYTLLDSMNGVENQVSFLAMAYPNVHPLPALWLASQYVKFASILLHPHECNIAFWANLLYAQFTGRLDELPIQGAVWNELLHVLLPRAPAIPIYLIHCHSRDMKAIGGRNAHIAARRRVADMSFAVNGATQDDGPPTRATSAENPTTSSNYRAQVIDRYPRLRITLSIPGHSRPSSPSKNQERARNEVSASLGSVSASVVVKNIPSINNWEYIVKRIDAFLKVSSLVAAESLLYASGEGAFRFSKAKKSDKGGGKKKKAIPSPGFEEVVVNGLSGTLLLDVIEVAARYDHADEVMELVRIQNLLNDYHDAVPLPDVSSSTPHSDDAQIQKDRELSEIVSRAVVMSTCSALTSSSSLTAATNTMKTMEELLWKELIEVKHLDLVAVAAGSRRLLQRLYEDEMASAFLSTLRYDRINIATGIPEGMTVPTEDPEEIRNLPGFHDHVTNEIQVSMVLVSPTKAAVYHTPSEAAHPSPFKGWLKEYVNSSIKALAQRYSDGERVRNVPTALLSAKAMDEDELEFCRRSSARSAVGTLYDRNEIAKTTWGIGAAAKNLSVRMSKKMKTQWSEIDQAELAATEEQPEVAVPPTPPTTSPLLSSTSKKSKRFDSVKAPSVHSNRSKSTVAGPATVVEVALPPPPPPEPKPVYQLFLQTDWVVHSSLVLRSPRPSVQTIDVLVLLLERRCALSSSALQMFFAASHYTNRWRHSSGEAISLSYQTHSHSDSLLHILVMNDQLQLTEYFLTYLLYYLCKWSYDDPNLKPGVFPVREDYPYWKKKPPQGSEASGEGENELMALAQAAAAASGQDRMHEQEPSTFLRMVLRLNRHGLTAFDYAHSPSMIQLLQRFGCVPPTYRPNPHTFTRALGLEEMLDADTHLMNPHFFNVPQLVLSSENFLRLQDGKNNARINRLAGIKGNEQARVKYEKSLLAAFQAAVSGKKGDIGNLDDTAEDKKNGAGASSRTSLRMLTKNKETEGGLDAGLIKHLLATQKMTGAIVLPYLLNEDVSLMHLGLCAHDDALLQMYGHRRNNLRDSGEHRSSTDSLTDRPSQLPPLNPEEDLEEKFIFSPYVLNLLPPDLTRSDGTGEGRVPSPRSHKLGASVKLPPMDVTNPPSADLNRSMLQAGGSVTSRLEKSQTALIASPPPGKRTGRSTPRAPKVKAPLSQRDIIAQLEKRQFVVYPLNLPPRPVITTDASTMDGKAAQSTVTAPDTKKATRGKKGKGKSVANAAAMAEGVFLNKELNLQHANAEEVVEESDEMNHASIMLSLTPMQLAQSSNKALVQRTPSFSNQYCSIPAEKLDAYFSIVVLPEEIQSTALQRRHRAARVITEANSETERIAQNLLMYRNSTQNNEELDPLQQVVTVPVFQPEPFSISATKHISMADYLDDWVKQYTSRRRRSFSSTGGGSSEAGDRRKKGDTRTSRSTSATTTAKRGSMHHGGSGGKKKRSNSPSLLPPMTKPIVGGRTSLPGRRVSILDVRGDVYMGSKRSSASEMTDEEAEVEVSPIHTAKPVGGVASAEQQGLMRILLRQFASCTGSKLSHDMGMHVAPNYDVEKIGDPISALFSKQSGSKTSEKK